MKTFDPISWRDEIRTCTDKDELETTLTEFLAELEKDKELIEKLGCGEFHNPKITKEFMGRMIVKREFQDEDVWIVAETAAFDRGPDRVGMESTPYFFRQAMKPAYDVFRVVAFLYHRSGTAANWDKMVRVPFYREMVGAWKVAVQQLAVENKNGFDISEVKGWAVNVCRSIGRMKLQVCGKKFEYATNSKA